MRTIERLVEQEIICNVSYLVATLAGFTPRMSTYDDARYDADLKSVMDLTAQAQELSAPVDDWEEAAREAGFERSDAGHMIRYPTDREAETADDWREACAIDDVEAYQREVFEHWFVTDWFADRLDAKGEKVDKDFAGHCVWARTTTGQGIASDSVIQAIHADLVREYGE